MRATEFISKSIKEAAHADELLQSELNDTAVASKKDAEPVMIPPLQQAIELQKASLGKDSKAIRKLTKDEVRPKSTKATSNKPKK
jgi:hypothetical protein